MGGGRRLDGGVEGTGRQGQRPEATPVLAHPAPAAAGRAKGRERKTKRGLGLSSGMDLCSFFFLSFVSLMYELTFSQTKMY